MPQGHHFGGRGRHAFAPGNAGRQQATAAGVRQADDLLSAVDPDAGRHPRDPADLHAAGHLPLRASPGRWPPLGHRYPISRATAAGRPGAGLHLGPRFHRRRPRGPGAGRQHLLRPGLPAHAQHAASRAARGHRLRLSGQGPAALRRGRTRRRAAGRLAGRKAGAAEIELRGDRASIFTTIACSRSPPACGPRRAANWRSRT